jgi:RNA polymerase sigma-70 factor (ECF subfamily)
VAASTRDIERVYHSRYGGFRRAVAAIAGEDASHDAVQEGFARAMEQRKQFRGGSLEAWVWKAVLRKAFDERRRRTPLPLEDVFDAELVASDRDPELAAAIRGLAPRRRLAVFLRYFADLSYGEIAEALEVAEGTVAATLAQARAELRAHLELEGVGR